MEIGASIWEALSAGGGTLALAFIVALAIGINALTVLFLGSAVVVLERFARMAKRPVGVMVAGAVLAASAAVMFVGVQAPELSVRPWADWWPAFGKLLLQLGAVTAIAILLCLAALRALSSPRLARASLLVLGLALGLYSASFARPGLAAAPLLVAGALALALQWRRRSSARGDCASEVERQLRWLALVLLPAPVIAAALELPSRELAVTGVGVGGGFFALVLFGLLPIAAAGLAAIRGSAEWFIAARYLFAKRRQVFISAITMICVVGIAAGVWLIITVLSVMNGFEATWRDEIVGNRAHFTLHHGLGVFEGYREIGKLVLATDGVTGVSPYLDAEGMVRREDGRIFSVRVRGIDPASVGDVTDLPDDIIAGSLEGLRLETGGGADAGGKGRASPPGLVIGNQLAAATGARLGESLLLISPYGGTLTPLGPAPRLVRFRVVGIFQSSFFQYDEIFTYTSLRAAQEFRNLGDVVDGLEARTDDFYRSRAVADSVVAGLEYPFFARDWKEYFPAFFQALKTERVMMFLLLTMIMVVAAFVIVATLIMMIMEKSGDIAILKAMGASDSSIERIFAIEGTLIGLAGTALGVVAGIAVTQQLGWIQQRIEDLTGIDTLPASIYQFSTLPSEVDPVQVAGVAIIAMILSLGATLLPSRQGARLDPVEGLRHE